MQQIMNEQQPGTTGKETPSDQAPRFRKRPLERPPAINDLKFIVKGTLSLMAKFINDLDWLVSRIGSKERK